MGSRAASSVCGGEGEWIESTCLLTHTPSLYPFFTPSHLPSFLLPSSSLAPCFSSPPPSPSFYLSCGSFTMHSPSALWVPEKGLSREEAQLLWG